MSHDVSPPLKAVNQPYQRTANNSFRNDLVFNNVCISEKVTRVTSIINCYFSLLEPEIFVKHTDVLVVIEVS